jgi:hypothetical protein
LNNKRVLIYILSFKSIIVRNLRVKYITAYKINLEIVLTYNLSLIKWINYKARDFIKFKRSKRLINSDLFLNFFFILFY